jgi:hypothetical protein
VRRLDAAFPSDSKQQKAKPLTAEDEGGLCVLSVGKVEAASRPFSFKLHGRAEHAAEREPGELCGKQNARRGGRFGGEICARA